MRTKSQEMVIKRDGRATEPGDLSRIDARRLFARTARTLLAERGIMLSDHTPLADAKLAEWEDPEL